MLSSLANCVAIYTQGCQALLSLYIVTEFPLVLKEQILSLFDFEAHPLTWFLWNLQTTKIVQSDKSIYNEGFRYIYIYTHAYTCMRRLWLPTWKLSKDRSGMLSSNSFIISHGPSPTPTKTMDKGNLLQYLKKKKIKLASNLRKQNCFYSINVTFCFFL